MNALTLLCGSTNKGKCTELRSALADMRVTLRSPEDAGIDESPHEEGDTFRANALQKARFYHERSRLPTLADDSGIFVEALADELGIHTRRWGKGADASDEEWIAYFLDRMKGEANKKARFVSCLCYIDENGDEHFFEGTCDGVITETLEAAYLPGLPIAACFKANGTDAVFSALSPDEKLAVSHRGIAVQAFKRYLKSIL